MVPSPPVFSTPITLHNHGPGSRATQRPRLCWPALTTIERGMAEREPEPTSVEGVLGALMSLRLPFSGLPEGRPRYGKSFQGSMSRGSQSLRDLRPT